MLRAVNAGFLLAVGVGILVAILSLAQGLEWLLTNQPVLLWSFFFGLVVASVVTVSSRIKQWTPPLWLAMAIGACRKQDKYIGICGQGPSDYPDFAVWLYEQGVSSLSLNPDSVVDTWLHLSKLNKPDSA